MGFWIAKRSIVLQFKVGNIRPKIYTGLTTDYWDSKNQRIPTKAPFAWEINEKLNKVEEYVQELQLETKMTGAIPDQKKIENDILALVQPEQQTNPMVEEKTVWEFVDIYIEKKKGVRSEGYLKNWPSLQDHVKEFAPDLKFSDLSPAFQERFSKWLYSEKKLKQNTVSNKITYLHVLTREARKLGYQTAFDFEDFSIKEVKNPVFYLDWETDLKAIRDVRLIPDLDKVRDRFVFRCNTGMREGELKSIKPSSFYENQGSTWMKYYDQKGKKWKQIALNEEALQIADKYNRKFPPISQQDENLLIKQVGMLAGLDTPHERISHYGSKIVRETFNSWELITTHTARRTFARRWYNLGGDIGKLSRYLGHADRRTTEVYIGLEDVEASMEMFRVMG